MIARPNTQTSLHSSLRGGIQFARDIGDNDDFAGLHAKGGRNLCVASRLMLGAGCRVEVSVQEVREVPGLRCREQEPLGQNAS